ncbi:MAG: hypothetical protein M3P01_04125 [Actinomycetota bacterium]|nr:hypothetical protein [Actinomycetota bacterium]
MAWSQEPPLILISECDEVNFCRRQLRRFARTGETFVVRAKSGMAIERLVRIFRTLSDVTWMPLQVAPDVVEVIVNPKLRVPVAFFLPNGPHGVERLSMEKDENGTWYASLDQSLSMHPEVTPTSD